MTVSAAFMSLEPHVEHLVDLAITKLYVCHRQCLLLRSGYELTEKFPAAQSLSPQVYWPPLMNTSKKTDCAWSPLLVSISQFGYCLCGI